MQSKIEVQKALDDHIRARPDLTQVSGLTLAEFSKRSKSLSEWKERLGFLEYLRDTVEAPVQKSGINWRREKMVLPAGVAHAC